VSGEIVVEDEVVYLRSGRGRALGGEIQASAELDFRGEPDRLQFLVRIDGLDVERLPASWSLPEQLRKFSGGLSGQAELVVTIQNAQVHTSGHGEGVITDARDAGLPADPVRLQLRTDGKGFHFTQPAPTGGVQPETKGPSDRPPAPVYSLLAQLLVRSIQTQPRKPGGRPDQGQTYLEINLGMKGVDPERLPGGGLELPFRVAGRLTFQVQAAMPVNAPRDLKAYRFKGTASLSRLVLADLEMEQVRARAAYDNGVLRLEELSGRVPDGVAPGAGEFDGTARLELFPRGDLTARLRLERTPACCVAST
jgi:hypothetical protein